MKKLIKYFYLPILIIAPILLFMACEETAETYSEFTEGGEQTYIGLPDTVIVKQGFEQLEFSIVLNADPKISNGVLETSNGSLNKEFQVTRQNSIQDTVNLTVDIDEGEHTFFIKMKDDNGNESIPYELNAIVYGPNYAFTLSTKPITGIDAYIETATIHWGASPSGCISSTLTYEDASETMQTIEISNDTQETAIENYKRGGQIMVTSSYKPTENAFELFESSPSTTTFPEEFILDYSSIVALKLPFDASDGCYGSTYARLTDGSTSDFWHSCDSAEDQYPFVMSFDLGAEVVLSGFKLDERAGCCGERSPASLQIWGSNDLSGGDTIDIDTTYDAEANTITDWETDASSKGWTKLTSLTANESYTFQLELPTDISAYRYIRIVAISSIEGGANANFNEFTFMPSQSQ